MTFKELLEKLGVGMIESGNLALNYTVIVHDDEQDEWEYQPKEVEFRHLDGQIIIHCEGIQLA